VTHLLLADGNERREKVDNALQIAGAATWPGPFVMQGVEAIAGFGIENDKVLLASTRFRIGDPVLRFLCFRREHQSAHSRRPQQAERQLLTAGAALARAGRASD
jgi:hypothetical protein